MTSEKQIVAERLNLEFERRGTSIGFVAANSEIPKAIIDNYLKASQELNLFEVAKICKSAGINFFRILTKSYSTSKTHFRNVSSEAAAIASKIENVFLIIKDNLPIPKFPSYNIDNEFNDRIAIIGTLIPVIQRFKDDYGNSVGEIITNLNLQIIPISSGGIEFDAFLLNCDPYYAICVNADYHPNRIKFSLLHEISHFLFDRDKILSIDETIRTNLYASTFDTNSRIEFLATKFAQYFLLPFDSLHRVCNNWRRWFDTLNIEYCQKLIDVYKVSIDVLLNGIRDFAEINGTLIQYNDLKDHLDHYLSPIVDQNIRNIVNDNRKSLFASISKNRFEYSEEVYTEIMKTLGA